MPLKQIEDLLRSEIGLDLDSIGVSALEQAVRARMQRCKLETREAYWDHLEQAPAELEQLIDEIVVRETWFFRETPAFELLAQRALAAQAGRDHPYRVLSVPCATGEEPYSIAISLLCAGLRPPAFEVYAVDVSQKSLESARQASYSKNSFRGVDDSYAHYFEPGPRGTQLLPSVREIVHFAQGNVLDPLLHAGGQFDAVFCRNLLIYLDRGSRAAALRNLTRLVRPDGALFAGHSESIEVMEFGFRKLGDTRCFAFTPPSAPLRVPARPAPAPARGQRSLNAARAPRPNAAAGRSGPAQAPERGQVARGKPELAPGSALDDARALADRGELGAAQRRCEQHLAAAGPSAEGLCLLGLLKKAAGNLGGARECFGKALYLDSAHYESLVHLALIHEHAGQLDAAQKLRRRAERSSRSKNG